MLIEQHFTVDAQLPAVWAFFKDVPAVASCVPGVEHVEAVDERTYQGMMHVKVGPLGFRLNGRVAEQEIDEAARSATLTVSADDRRLGGGVNATLRLRLSEVPGGTAVTLETEAAVFGRLGQLGQGVVKLAADAVMKDFAARVRRRIAQPGAGES